MIDIFFSFSDRIESNDSIRNELDEIVGGLQGYLSHVKTKGQKAQRDYEVLLSEKMNLEDQCRKLEQELSVLDSEAGKVPTLEQVKWASSNHWKYQT